MTTALETVTAPMPQLTEPGDHDRFSHYVRKDALDAALFDGFPAVALCGKRWLPTKDFTKYPVCPQCREIYEGLPPGEGEQ